MRDRKTLLNQFRPWMVSALQNHVNEGCSVRSFAGAYNLNHHHFQIWLREVPEFREINQKYIEKLQAKRRSCS